jgi:hypothetical protein
MDEDIEPKHILLGVVVLIALALFIFTMLGGFGRIIGREFQKFDAETSAQIYDNSRQFQQGTNRDIARYCRDWKDAPHSGQQAISDLIASTIDMYQGPLTPSNEKCKMELGL